MFAASALMKGLKWLKINVKQKKLDYFWRGGKDVIKPRTKSSCAMKGKQGAEKTMSGQTNGDGKPKRKGGICRSLWFMKRCLCRFLVFLAENCPLLMTAKGCTFNNPQCAVPGDLPGTCTADFGSIHPSSRRLALG